MALETQVAVRIDQSTKEKLEGIARRQGRPLASLIRRILAAAADGTPIAKELVDLPVRLD